MLKSLYTHFILFLIRPALQEQARRDRKIDKATTDLVVFDIRESGHIARALEQSYGLRRTGK